LRDTLPPATHISLLFSDHGLVPRSGVTPDALHFGDPMMCLTAEATLHVTRVGRKDRNDRLAVSFANKSPDAPPRLCAKISPLVHDDGALMRQSIRENEAVNGLLIIHIQDFCEQANPAVRTLVGLSVTPSHAAAEAGLGL
jgi:hypothetical protein